MLPEVDKQEVHQLFSELKYWLWNNYTQSDEFWHKNPYGWKRYEAVLKFMDGSDDTHLLPAFSEYISHIDSQRKLNFKETFPELSHLL